MLSQKIIVRPQNHWKYVAYLTLIRSESIVPRSRRSMNWNEALTAIGPLWVTRLLNVLLASGTSVYALALVLEAGILSTPFNKDDVMWHVWLFDWQETITASHVCRYSVNHSNVPNVHLISVHGLIWHVKFPKVVQAHTLGEVGILGTFLLRVYSRTMLPILLKSVYIWQTRSKK